MDSPVPTAPLTPTPVVSKPKINWLVLSLVALAHFIIGTGAGLLISKYFYSQKAVPPTQVETSSTQAVSIKNYKSDNQLVSFDYPQSEVNVSETEQEIDIGWGLDAFLISVHSEVSSLDPKNWWLKNKDHANFPATFTTSKFLGKDSIDVSFPSSSEYGSKRVILIKNGDRNYEIWAYNFESTQKTLTDQILSTFKFKNLTLYTNSDFKFSFDLKSGEHVVECPNKNQDNDYIAVWTITHELSGADCGVDGSMNTVIADRKNTSSITFLEDRIKSWQTYYQISKTPITVSGISGFKVTGKKSLRQETQELPIPDTFDVEIFIKNGIFYQIGADYQNRNFAVLN